MAKPNVPAILIVSKDPHEASILDAELQLSGYLNAVCTTVSAQEAAALAGKHSLALAICISPQNDADTTALCETLHNDQGIPVLLLGGETGTTDASLPYPCPVQDLLETVYRFVPPPLSLPAIETGKLADRETERMYHDLFDRASDMILLIDLDTHVIVQANQQAVVGYGYSHRELVGMSLLQIVPQEQHESIWENTQHMRQEQGPLRVTQRTHIRKDGTPMTVTVSASLIDYGGRKVFQDIIRDETDRVRIEQNLVRANQALEHHQEYLEEQVQERMAEVHRAYGKLQGEVAERRRAEKGLRENEARLRSIIGAMPVLLDAFDEQNRVIYWNEECVRVTGYTTREVIGNPRIWEILYPDRDYREWVISTTKERESFYNQEFELTCKDGTKRTISWSNISGQAPIPGWATWAVGVDITERVRAEKDRQEDERRSSRFAEMRLALIEYAANHSLNELLTRALDKVSAFVESPIGFWHFVEPDQKTLSLQQWSTRTLEEFCRTEGRGMHFPIDRAGVWVDCVHVKKPVIHNDYASLPHRKGMPEGHAPVIRELVVPVMRENRVAAILGVGNKATDYTEEDVEAASYLADVTWEIVQQKRAHETRIRLTTAIEQSAESIIITDAQGAILYVNPTFERVSGYSRDEAMGQNPRILKSGQQDAAFYEDLWTTIQSGQVWHGRFVNKHKDGTLYIEDATISPVRDESDEIVNYVAVKRDVTSELGLEERYRQSQKMEAIGRLAGGVAHDFNNLLTAMQGYTSLLLDGFSGDDPHDWPPGASIRADLDEILTGALRASALTRQLLAFSRKQVLQPQVLDLNRVLSGVENMIRRLIGEDIKVTSVLASRLGRIRADPGQIEQVIMNLSVNARDAMPRGGQLTFETTNAVLDAAYTRMHPDVEPGPYVRLSVSDTGVGMTEEVKLHLFEPFYTTKGEGRGTGLGLATVWGIVDQSGGHIEVYSELGIGTTFKVYLPRVDGTYREESPEQPDRGLPTGTETILLAEDEEAVRELTCRVLNECGYTVLAPESSDQALRLGQEYASPIHLLLTDVVMPELGGHELAAQLAPLRPEMRVLYISGYTDDALAHHGVLDPGVILLEKPFTPDALARKVREVLDRQTPGETPT